MHLNKLRDQIDTKKESFKNIHSQCEEMKEKISECKSTMKLEDSRTAYAISLYSKISNITWDYNSSEAKLVGRKCAFL